MGTYQQVTALEHTLIIRPRISLWTGRGTFNRSDLGADAVHLPPRTLTTDGAITLCKRETIVKMESLRAAVDRDFAAFCVRFLDGFATDCGNLQRAIAVMDDHRPEFENLRVQLLDGFEANISEWIAENPRWGHMVRKHLPTKEYVANRVQYKAFIFRAQMASESAPEAPENVGMVTEVNGLSGQLFAEIEKDAQAFRERSLTGRDEVTQDAVRPIRRMREKLIALCYLDRRIDPVVQQIDSALAGLPEKGKMKGAALTTLEGIVGFLADAERMKRHGAGVLEASNDGEAVFDGLAVSDPEIPASDTSGHQALISAEGEPESNNTEHNAPPGREMGVVETVLDDPREADLGGPDVGEEATDDSDPETIVPPNTTGSPAWESGGITF